MNDQRIRKASLSDIERMNERGELFHNPNAAEGAPEGEELGRDFWANAKVEEPKSPATKPVLLKLEPEVFEFFKSQGKGHVSKMQAVLKAYVKAHRSP